MTQRRRFALLKQPFILDALGDVTVSTPVLGDILQYNGTVWVNTPTASLSGLSEAIDDRVAALLSIGNGLSATYNDPGNTYTLSANIDAVSLEFATGVMRRAALTGDVTASAGSNTTTIANDAVTYAKMQNVSATSRFLGRITAGAGDPEELTGTQATTLLDAFTSALKGLVPASGGGTANYLRADGTWNAPPGSGGGSGSTYGVYATADQSKTSDTTLADDTTLIATLNANKKYRIEVEAWTDTNATADLKTDFNFTGTTTSMLWSVNWSFFTTANIASTPANVSSGFVYGNGNNQVVVYNLTGTQTLVGKHVVQIEVGASGGTFSYRWAQNTSNGTATVRRRNSCMLVTEIA